MDRIILQVLLAIGMVLSIYSRHFGMPVWVFWPFFIVLIMISYLTLKDGQGFQKTLTIMIFVVAVSFIQIAALPYGYLMTSDDVFEAQFAQTIVDNGVWDPKDGSGFADNYYGYSPALHIIIASISTVTGMDAYWVVKYFLPTIFKLMMAIMVLLLVREFDPKNAYMAAFIFAGCSGFAFIGITRRTMAGIFVLYAIYSLIKSRSPGWNILFFVFSIMAIISNRTISMYFMFFLVGAWFYSLGARLFRKRIFKGLFSKMVVYSVLFVLMQVMTRHIFFKSDGSYVDSIMNIVNMLSLDMLFSGASGKGGVNIYQTSETLLIYSGQAIFLGLAGLAFLAYLYKGKLKKKPFFLYFSLASFVIYSATPLLMVTEYDIAVLIILWLISVPVSLYFAYGIGKLPKIVALALILVIFSGNILMGLYTPRLINRMPDEDVVVGSDQRSKTYGLFRSAQWLSLRYPGSTVLGDEDVFETYSGLYSFDVNFYLNYIETIYLGGYVEIFREKRDFEFGSYAHTLYRAPVDFIVVNNAIIANQHKIIGDVGYDTLKGFDLRYDKIYSNDDASIYSTGDIFA